MQQAKQLVQQLRRTIRPHPKQQRIRRYHANGSLPWTDGYEDHRWQVINEVLNSDLLALFRQDVPLPPHYGWRLDERVVEYPWLFAHLSDTPARMLDAGSVLNHRPIIPHIAARHKHLTVLTLAPEGIAFWQQAISYHYGDLRDLPFRDAWFDEIVCLSTLEHVGMDNRGYRADDPGSSNAASYTAAATELWRVLKPDGVLFVSVPFGQYQRVEWNGVPFMQQFEASMLRQLEACFEDGDIRTWFYQYKPEGWIVSTEDDCAGLAYFNIHAASDYDDDYAAAARAVCCMEVRKSAAGQ